MGHDRGFPCLHDDPNHDGRCSTPLPPEFVDFAATRFFEIGGDYWRTNRTARPPHQVEFLRADGSWVTSRPYPTEEVFLAATDGMRREIKPEEVPACPA